MPLTMPCVSCGGKMEEQFHTCDNKEVTFYCGTCGKIETVSTEKLRELLIKGVLRR